LSPTIIVAWFSVVRKARPGILVLTAIFTSLIGTFLLVTHGNPTSLSISPAARGATPVMSHSLRYLCYDACTQIKQNNMPRER